MCVFGFSFSDPSVVVFQIRRADWWRKRLGFAVSAAAIVSNSPSEGGRKALWFLPYIAFLLTLIVNVGFCSYV